MNLVLQARVFDLLGISGDEQRAKFGFLLDALGMGAPPHVPAHAPRRSGTAVTGGGGVMSTV